MNLDASHILQRIDQLAAVHPNKIAVRESGEFLTYGELSSLSCAFAKELVSRDVNRGDLVCVLARPSRAFVVSALAIWRCAAAYVPVEPEMPEARLRKILSQAEPRLLISHVGGGVGFDEIQSIVVDGVPHSFYGQDVELPEPSLDDIAYVIYTSGSTGEPKGVIVGHDNLAAMVSAFSNHFQLSDSDTVSAVANLTFDASVAEYWPALSSGATVSIAMPHIVGSVHGLCSWLSEEAITFAWLPTPMMEVLLKEGDSRLLSGLRMLQTAGDRLRVRPPPDWPVPVENSYGPTEATVIATSSVVSSHGTELPDLGWPLPGVEVYILNRQGQPVDVGESGEIHISGPGVSRGYLGDLGLTSQKFLSNPFSGRQGSRMYATGDIGYWDAEGRLHFLQRSDSQVKVRGHRIELGDVEFSLMSIEGIKQAACSMRDGSLLCAYYATDGVLGETDVRAALADRLPSYMIPDRLKVVDRIPTTSSGKLDREAVVSNVDWAVSEELAVPQDSAEREFLGFMRSVSDVKLGWNDDFFSSGGNSIKAIILIEGLRQKFDVNIALEHMFKCRTPSAIYDLIASLSTGDEEMGGGVAARDDKWRDHIPLSSSQRSVWYVASLEPDDRAYHAKACLRIRGRVQAHHIQQALTDVVARHEIFRTHFESISGEPVQVVDRPIAVPLPEVDLRHLSPNEAEQQLASLQQGYINRPFDLSKSPLVRWCLVWLPERQAALLHVEHHLVHDGWSYNLFLRDFLRCYQSRSRGTVHKFPSSLQYADFCVAQQQWLESSQALESEAYWVSKLSDAKPTISLPFNGDHEAKGGRTLRVHFPRSSWRRLDQWCRRNGCTKFAFVLAAFSYVLYRYSSQNDFCVGSAFANRSWGETSDIIGMLINTVALRVRFDRSAKVIDHVGACMRICQDAQIHQAFPFEEVVKKANPERSGSENPLFQVFLGFHDSPLPEVRVDDFEDVQVIEALDSNAAKFDLSLIVIPRSGQVGKDDPVHMLWEFSSRRFSSSFIERLTQDFAAVVDQFIDGANIPISEVAVGVPSLVRQLPLPAQAATSTPLERIDRVRQEVGGSSTAIVYGRSCWSYGELMNDVDVAARRLASRGVKPGDLVAILLERTPEFVIFMLAVQKLGAAYIPLDPSYPSYRIEQILSDCRPSLVVDERSIGDKYDSSPSVIGSTTNPRDAAYVIYTSGSTGCPKGVVVTHSNLSAFLDAMEDQFPLARGDRWCAVTSMAFDISVLECLLPLVTGATLVMATSEVVVDAQRLSDLITRESITHMQATPSTWRALMDLNWDSSPRGLIGLCGGEVLPEPLASEIRGMGIVLTNMYGPTETTIWSCVHHVTEEPGPVAIGAPIPGTCISIVDEQMQAVPSGAIGELVIGGAGVALGYLGQKELTEEKFIKCPLTKGGRAYRSGDLASLDMFNRLHFHGRVDSQVKISGHRVETTEVEHVVESTEGVLQCAIKAVSQSSDILLAAWIVLDPCCTIENIRYQVQHKLPSFMVPRLWLQVESLPLTPNGKVDRASLEVPSSAHSGRKPVKRVEKEVCDLLSSLLADVPIDPDAGFYANGGHSLVAMRLVALINRRYGTSMMVTDMLFLDTPAAIAAHIDDQCSRGSGETVVV